MAPMLLWGIYAGLDYAPCPRRVFIYLKEKKIPSSVVTVFHSDEEAKEKGFPPKPEGYVPILGIPKPGQDGEYTWLFQSMAILEFLEDYCDAHPEVSPVPSLRGQDPLQRAQIRAVMAWTHEIFESFAMTCAFGNETYVKMLKRSTINVQAGKETEAQAKRHTLDYLENHILAASDPEALGSGKDGTATIADIALFATWQFCVGTYGKDFAKGYPNISKVMEAFDKRPSAPLEQFPPPGTEIWKAGWIDGLWA